LDARTNQKKPGNVPRNCLNAPASKPKRNNLHSLSLAKRASDHSRIGC
jgi:hypothetical protein